MTCVGESGKECCLNLAREDVWNKNFIWKQLRDDTWTEMYFPNDSVVNI